MALTAGTRLGPYEIVDAIGEGGMGEVYRARDTRLGRTVALKVVRSGLTADQEFRQRFEREARAISGLSHPHICTLHDVGRHDGIDFLVMEYLDGEPLSRRLSRGPLPLDLAIRCAIQIAEALDEAHSRGILHRDLKPANVMLTRSGAARGSAPDAKLLDFGLAKSVSGHPSLDAGDPGATRSARQEMTSAGTIVGTLSYLAPEQLEGKPGDARSDIFAFGAVVYEMITGRRAFDGPTPAAIIGAILQAEPVPLRRLRADAPAALEHLVMVCLAKDPDARWSSARDVVLLLEGLRSGQLSGATSAPTRIERRWLPWSLAAAALLLAAVFGSREFLRDNPASEPVRRLDIAPPAGATLELGSAPQVSPDGKSIAFVAVDSSGQSRLYLRALDAVAAEALPDTEGATQPFWSPDSTALGFFAGARLRTIAVRGGRARTLAAAPVPRGGTWNADGLIVFVPSPPSRLHQVRATGGDPTPVETVPPSSCWFPAFLPDGRRILCTGLNASRRVDALYIASLDSSDTTPLVKTSGAGAAIAHGRLLYRREGELVAQHLDPETFQLTGTPAMVAPEVAAHPLTYQTLFSTSTDGTLAYIPPSGGSMLVWYDRNGKELGTVGARGNYNSIALTRDEQRVFVDQANASGDVDIWMLETASGTPTRLTFHEAVDFYPLAAPDGQRIVFGSLRTGTPVVFEQQPAAPGSETILLQVPRVPVNTSHWSADGRFIIHRALYPGTGWDIWALETTGERRHIPLVQTVHDERFGRLSDDNRWLAYSSSQTGDFNIYVQPFPAGGATWQVSRGGGEEPRWRRDGRELFYLAPDKTLMAVQVDASGGALRFGEPRALFSTHATQWEGFGSQYQPSADGQRFLVNRLPDDAAATPVAVILNWPASASR